MDKIPNLYVSGDDLSDILSKLDDLRADANCVKLDPDLVRRLVKDHQALLTYHRAYFK